MSEVNKEAQEAKVTYVTHAEFQSFINAIEDYFRVQESRSIQKDVLIEVCLNVLHEKLGVPKEDIENMALQTMDEFSKRINSLQEQMVEEAEAAVEQAEVKAEEQTDTNTKE